MQNDNLHKNFAPIYETQNEKDLSIEFGYQRYKMRKFSIIPQNTNYYSPHPIRTNDALA